LYFETTKAVHSKHELFIDLKDKKPIDFIELKLKDASRYLFTKGIGGINSGGDGKFCIRLYKVTSYNYPF
jgi:hypothetical protein